MKLAAGLKAQPCAYSRTASNAATYMADCAETGAPAASNVGGWSFRNPRRNLT
jgi:hypothetical protein